MAMTNKRPARIVCAIRGGISSRYAEERALELSKERSADIVFVHIIDPELVHRTEKPLSEAVLTEMEYMGESFLCIAAERARIQHVNAQKVVLHGPVTETLENYLTDSQTTVLVIGSPEHHAKHSTLSKQRFDGFVEHLRTDLDIEVHVV
jgi:nucleotide-binding universal stress UspA family protein